MSAISMQEIDAMQHSQLVKVPKNSLQQHILWSRKRYKELYSAHLKLIVVYEDTRNDACAYKKAVNDERAQFVSVNNTWLARVFLFLLRRLCVSEKPAVALFEYRIK